MGFFPDTFKTKFPSKSVTVALVLPFSTTVAPMIGSPVASVTLPFTSCWAYILPATMSMNITITVRKILVVLTDINSSFSIKQNF